MRHPVRSAVITPLVASLILAAAVGAEPQGSPSAAVVGTAPLSSPPSAGVAGQDAPPPPAGALPQDLLATVSGTVVDLTVADNGDLIYCTREREVGRITTGGVVTVLATAATGPFPYNLAAVIEDLGGNIAVIDSLGDIYRLNGGAAPAVLAYDDPWMMGNPTDMIVDENGSFLVASESPTSGTRALNWVSYDGSRWGYYLIEHSPLQLAVDPTSSDLLLADTAGGGALRLVESDYGPHPTTPLDTTTHPGFTVANDDGDMAVENDGDVFFVAGGTVYWHDLSSAFTLNYASGYNQLRGITIAASSGNVPSPSGWSVYVAEGGSPTNIRELGGVNPPGSVRHPNLGWVPGTGWNQLIFNGIQVHELATDRNGHLLIGGDLWGGQPSLRRVELPSFAVTTIASEANGLTSCVEGIAVDPNGLIYALTRDGQIHSIRENPFLITTVFADPLNQITAGKDLVYARNKKLYVADRDGWGTGEVLEVDIATGTAVTLTSAREARGLAADPTRAGLIVAEWVNGGFAGEVGRLDPTTGAITPIPGLSGLNYTNDSVWGDGDLALNAKGSIYSFSEDDWTLAQYEEWRGGFARIGSGYLSHPSGVTIAPSTPDASNTTGWSLYVSEYDHLYELRNHPAPAPTIFDPDSPPVGRYLGSISPEHGRPRAMITDPSGGGLLISTSAGKLLRIDDSSGTVIVRADASEGLAGDLVGLAAMSTGTIVAVTDDGVVWKIEPMIGYAARVVFNNSSMDLVDVRGLCLDGEDRPIIIDRLAGNDGGRTWRLEGGDVQLLSRNVRGMRPAIDPLTADIFLTQQGASGGQGGEVLRIDAFVDPPSHGHWKGSVFFDLAVGERGGDIVFDDEGNFYIAEADTGNVIGCARNNGARAVMAGNYVEPIAVALAPGRAGTAGPSGTSLFVLDGYVVWETGVTGLPAFDPPATPPGLAPPATLRIHGSLELNTTIRMTASNPAAAGKVYWIFPSFYGKRPGVKLAILGDWTDNRVLPNNYDPLWTATTAGTFFPMFVSVLDGAGNSHPSTGIIVPDDPSLFGLDNFLDFAWVVVESGATNGVSYLGGTAQLLFGY